MPHWKKNMVRSLIVQKNPAVEAINKIEVAEDQRTGAETEEAKKKGRMPPTINGVNVQITIHFAIRCYECTKKRRPKLVYRGSARSIA